MKVLLDTCVLAEIRHPRGHGAVKAAVAKMPDEALFLSALTIGEIAKGIALLASGQRKQALTVWLNGLHARFNDRILPIEVETAQLWGDLTARAQKIGILMPAVDGLLSATALRYGMRIMTRNTQHFQASGAIVLNPWQDGS